MRLIFSTLEYKVQDQDTVEKIAARFDCTPGQIVKLNKLPSRVLFTGQTILVPDGTSVQEVEEPEKREINRPDNLPITSTCLSHLHRPSESSDFLASDDAECLRKFLKCISERWMINYDKNSSTTINIPGVFIATPVCVMFDPDVTTEENFDKIQRNYGVVANIDDVIAISLYELKLDKAARRKFRSESDSKEYLHTVDSHRHSDTPPSLERSCSPMNSRDKTDAIGTITGDEIDEASSGHSRTSSVSSYLDSSSSMTPGSLKHKLSSSIQKFKIWKLYESSETKVDRRPLFAQPSELNTKKLSLPSGPRGCIDIFASLPASPTKLSNPEIHLSVPTHFDNIRANFHAMESFVKKTIDLCSNLHHFYDAMFKILKMQSSEQSVSCHKSLKYAYYLSMWLKTTNDEYGESDDASIFGETSRLTGSSSTLTTENIIQKSTDSIPSTSLSSRTKRIWFSIPAEKIDALYLLFLQWCNLDPSLCNVDDEDETDVFENISRPGIVSGGKLENGSDVVKFIVVDDVKYIDTPAINEIPLLGLSHIESNFQIPKIKLVWQLYKLDDFKRHFSLHDLTENFFLPLPDGSDSSRLLTESVVRRLMGALPARAQGYPWSSIYSSQDHGFSLRTMYSKTSRWHDDTSPMMLVVQDLEKHIFGAIISCPLHVSEHFYGSGESLLFTTYPQFRVYRWTGANLFICKGSIDSLAIGAGKGSFGLYLDADLLYGRTQPCETFGNQPLTEPTDFTVSGIEVFGFSLT